MNVFPGTVDVGGSYRSAGATEEKVQASMEVSCTLINTRRAAAMPKVVRFGMLLQGSRCKGGLVWHESFRVCGAGRDLTKAPGIFPLMIPPSSCESQLETQVQAVRRMRCWPQARTVMFAAPAPNGRSTAMMMMRAERRQGVARWHVWIPTAFRQPKAWASQK